MKYKKMQFSTQLSELYGRDNYESHIEVGREYWYFWGTDSDVYKHTKQTWNKIKITYIRSGVVFYVLSDFPDYPEDFFPFKCYMASALVYAQIDPMKDVPWSKFDIERGKEYIEKRYCFDDERTVVMNWDNSKEVELNDDEMDLLDKVTLKEL